MADLSIIAWTHHTFNPWMGCVKISPGCKHCYAETLTKNRMGLKVWGPAATATRQVTSEAYWRKPFRWAFDANIGVLRDNKGKVIRKLAPGERPRVFAGSLCDVFEDHPVAEATRPRLWELIRATPELDWLLLTKRPERIAQSLPREWDADASVRSWVAGWGPNGWPNVWLGTSIEDRERCRRRDELVKTPAVVHFISAEPLLEDIAGTLNLDDIEWVIVGGESGPGFRPMDLAWARNLRAVCAIARTAFFFKQSAAPRTEMGTELDGKIVRAYPVVVR